MAINILNHFLWQNNASDYNVITSSFPIRNSCSPRYSRRSIAYCTSATDRICTAFILTLSLEFLNEKRSTSIKSHLRQTKFPDAMQYT